MNLTTLEKLAFRLAVEAPERRGKYVDRASVDWATIEETRAELERLGIDWRAVLRRRKEIERERLTKGILL